LELIHTGYREKPPKGFSYPVGAEIISSALQDVPQFSLAIIYFSWKDTFWASKYNAKLKAFGKITTLRVSYHHEWHISDGTWLINVHAVPSAHKQTARDQLLDKLPALAHELVQTPVEPDHFHWEMQYDLATLPPASR
jgi:beta-xylosidase